MKQHEYDEREIDRVALEVATQKVESLVEKVVATAMAGADPLSVARVASFAEECGMTKDEVSDTVKAIKPVLMDAMQNAGITDKFLVDKIKEGLDAEEVRHFAFKGEVVSERRVVAHGERRQMLDIALKLRDAFPKTQMDLNVNQAQIIRLPAKKPIGAPVSAGVIDAVVLKTSNQ